MYQVTDIFLSAGEYPGQSGTVFSLRRHGRVKMQGEIGASAEYIVVPVHS